MEKIIKLLDDYDRDLRPYAGEAKYTIWDNHIELAKYLIDNDVKQVVHGQWEKVTGGMVTLGDCSECKTRQPVIGTNYCKHCGAKMSLEEEVI